MAKLAKLVQSSTKIQHLGLGGTELTEAGIETLITQGINLNSSLRAVTMHRMFHFLSSLDDIIDLL